MVDAVARLAQANPKAGVVFDFYQNGQRVKSAEGGNTLQDFLNTAHSLMGQAGRK